MREDDRKRLKKESLTLIKNLDVVSVNDILFRDGVLDDEDLEMIQNPMNTTKGKVRLLLKILRNHPSDDVFKKFCLAIRESGEENEYLADALMNADITGIHDEGMDQPDFNVNQLNAQLVQQWDLMLNMKERYRQELEAMKRRLESMEETPNRRNSNEWRLKDSVDGAGFEDKNVRAYVAKLCTEPSHTTSDGAPPEVNLFPSDLWMHRTRVRPPPPMSVEDEASYLGVDIVRYILYKKNILRLEKSPPAERPAVQVLRQMVEELNTKIDFDNLLQQLDSTELDGFSTFKSIGDEIFGEDSKDCNWGRVAAWYAFWAHVATSLPTDRVQETVNIFGNYIGFYLAQHLSDWITTHGGWDGFVQYGNNISPAQRSWSWGSSFMKLFEYVGYIPWRLMIEQYPHRP